MAQKFASFFLASERETCASTVLDWSFRAPRIYQIAHAGVPHLQQMEMVINTDKEMLDWLINRTDTTHAGIKFIPFWTG